MLEDPKSSAEMGGPAVRRKRRAGSRAVLLLKSFAPVSLQARVVAALLPAALWYRVAIAMSRWQGRMIRLLRRDGVPAEILVRESWLKELSRYGAFPIPWRLHGREVLDQYSIPGPVVYLGMHIAMADIAVRVLTELKYPDWRPIIGVGNSYCIVGLNRTIPAITASPYVLVQMRRAILEGYSIACHVDPDHLSGVFSAKPMHVAGRLGVPVVLMWSEIARDGVIDVMFRLAPHPFCENEQAIEQNLQFFRELGGRILRGDRTRSAEAHDQAIAGTLEPATRLEPGSHRA